MIKTLNIGTSQFSNNLIQGPLAGISCSPFRLPAHQLSQPAYTCTEMISCKTLINTDIERQLRFTKIDSDEGPVCFQLSANNPQELGQATRMVTDMGASLIDLNCGCPVKKIRTKGAGSRLLSDGSKLAQMIEAMNKNTHLPVTIKIRVDGNSNDKFNHEIARVINDVELDALIVHGRHWTEHYETACHYEHIQFFVDALNIPVIGNGDIRCQTSLKKMFATGCDGVMIGRAGVGQPWLIAKLIAEYHNQTFTMPSNQAIQHLFIEHVSQLIELLNSEKFAILQARTFAKYYAQHLPSQLQFTQSVQQCHSLDELIKITDRHFCSKK